MPGRRVSVPVVGEPQALGQTQAGQGLGVEVRPICHVRIVSATVDYRYIFSCYIHKTLKESCLRRKIHFNRVYHSKTTKLILLDSLLQEAEHVARLYVSDSWGSQL